MISRDDLRNLPRRAARPRGLIDGALKASLLVALVVQGMGAVPVQARADHRLGLDGMEAHCTTIHTVNLPEEALREYGIEAREGTGLITCLVQPSVERGDPDNLPAEVEAEYQRIGQAPLPIDMHETDLTSYVGTYRINSDYPLQFSVRMLVNGEVAVMTFEDLHPRI